jgi:hypothetical protein
LCSARAAEGGHRAQPYARAAGTDFLHHRLHDLDQQTGAVGDAAAIRPDAVVHAVAQELVEQVGVCRVYLDAVKAGVHRVARRAAVVVDQARDFVVAQGARR